MDIYRNAGFLFAAFTVVWVGVFAYVLFLSSRQKKLRQGLNLLKERLKEKTTGNDQT